MNLTVRTTFQGPTDTKGSRICAAGGGKRLSMPWDHALSSSENHAEAARTLASRVFDADPGEPQFVNDEIPTGYKFTFAVDIDTRDA